MLFNKRLEIIRDMIYSGKWSTARAAASGCPVAFEYVREYVSNVEPLVSGCFEDAMYGDGCGDGDGFSGDGYGYVSGDGGGGGFSGIVNGDGDGDGNGYGDGDGDGYGDSGSRGGYAML